MKAINDLTDAGGRKKAIVIDLDELKRSGQTGRDIVIQLQEELEADNPHPTNCKKLQGFDDTYRTPIGEYRVL